jgi:hypothetical protein
MSTSTDSYMVRIEFTFQDERFHEFVGPFDHHFAHLFTTACAYSPYMHGITPVRIEKAKILDAEEYYRWTGNHIPYRPYASAEADVL